MKKRCLILLSSIMYCLLVIAIVKIKIHTKNKTISTINNNIVVNFEVTAQSCIVIDANNNKILYSKNMNKKMLPASITKILTAITAIETYPLDDYIYIDSSIPNEIGSKIYLKEGDYISVENLLYGLLLNSGNDAAIALANHYSNNYSDFVVLMNDLAKKIGANNSNFTNPSGLDELTENKTTAYDMAIITSYAIKNQTFLKIFGTKSKIINLNDHTIYLHHKHRLIQNNEMAIGGKTGYTEKAGRTLVTCFEKNDNRIIVVTIDAYNDWQIHSKFADLFLIENVNNSTIYLLSYDLIANEPLIERLRGKKDD